MRFNVAEIRDAGSVKQEGVLEAQNLLGSSPDFVIFRYPLKAQVVAQMTSSEILVSGVVSTVLSLSCARCLESFERPYTVRFQEVFGADQQEFDTSNEMREAVLLDLPVKTVCQEKCKGLCFHCGANLNMTTCQCAFQHGDSRWDALRQYPFKK